MIKVNDKENDVYENKISQKNIYQKSKNDLREFSVVHFL